MPVSVRLTMRLEVVHSERLTEDLQWPPRRELEENGAQDTTDSRTHSNTELDSGLELETTSLSNNNNAMPEALISMFMR